MIPIQVLIAAVLFLFCSFILVCLFILVCPCHYYIEGNRHKNLEGILSVKVAFIKMRLKIAEAGNYQGGLYVWNWKLINVQRQDLREKKKNIQNKDRKVTSPSMRRLGSLKLRKLCAWIGGLDRNRLNLMLELVQKIYKQMCPQKLLLQGKLGFTDPYYTGLLAAVLFCFPIEKVNIEPVFSKPTCELTIQLKGQLILGVLFYYFLYFLRICSFRTILRGKIKKKREEKCYGI